MLAFAFFACASGLSTDHFMGAPTSSLVAKKDALHMWAAAEAEQREATIEERQAIDHAADAKAIHKVAVDEAKFEEARAKKELKGEDLDAMLAVVRDEEARKDTDVKQIENIAAKEKRDAADTKNEAAQVRHDAAEAETAMMPTRNTTQTIDKATTKPAALLSAKTCPSTSFHASVSNDAAGTPVWTERSLAEGESTQSAPTGVRMTSSRFVVQAPSPSRPCHATSTSTRP
jgi:hypothetical protein